MPALRDVPAGQRPCVSLRTARHEQAHDQTVCQRPAPPYGDPKPASWRTVQTHQRYSRGVHKVYPASPQSEGAEIYKLVSSGHQNSFR